MKITQQTNLEGLEPYCFNRLHHIPNTLFWILVEMCDRCPGISYQYARNAYKDIYSKAEIKQAFADLAVIGPLWDIQLPAYDGPSYELETDEK